MKYLFKVQMTCEGCSKAIGRVLTRLGVDKLEISLPNQSVLVVTDKAYDTVLNTIKKTGKTVHSGTTLED
ncbi:copper chaperone Atx1 [Schizosaccharomyces japonicus yFS275]|uniref:Copper chaperone Atx1 n=1 Tax=Schizosaccharomyces japonicus (strain yFS275 / FY16936) TaxID=402676 RepID=B6K3P1_SCHJY|nr:copper chaperone Atx1 [Schizosaccharomyces japonicus yFS275]EEB08098.1 copper chaperone Atx1 [Schizosaccharomyces japonicus yFS275]